MEKKYLGYGGYYQLFVLSVKENRKKTLFGSVNEFFSNPKKYV